MKNKRVPRQLQAAGALVRTIAGNPSIVREFVRGLVAPSAGPTAPADSDRKHPDGLDDYPRTTGASADIARPPREVLQFAANLSRLPEWFVIHNGWRGTPPEQAAVGEKFTQQVKLMGIPADVSWTVTAMDDTTLALRGKGPMGVVLALWLTAVATGEGTRLWLDLGLDGDPVKGPMGASVIRSTHDAITASIRVFVSLLSDAPPPVDLDSPVLHHASGTMLDPRTPVLVGVGQYVQRDPEAALLDPVALSVLALRAAGHDSGTADRMLRAADAVYAVASTSWTYRDQAALVAAAIGAAPRETVMSSPFGGDGAQLLINAAAQAVADGDANIVLVTGAEAGATLAAAQRRGVTPQWPEQPAGIAPTRTIGSDRTANNDAETGVGLGAPIYMYALMESALRSRTGETPEEHRQTIAALWAQMSEIGARNRHAWMPQVFTADELATTGDDNRMISSPYSKLLCANLQVNLASGLIVCSAAAAAAANIPQDKWVFIHAGAAAHDEWFVSERAELAASPAIKAIGSAALRHAGLTIDDVAHIDLYSCFPVAVQIAAREFGLPINDPNRPLSVTGGLTFGGGPGNNYGSHAVATMVERLRCDPSAYGLSTSLGWYVTKHAVGIYSATPPKQPFRQLTPRVDRPASRPVAGEYRGPGVLEAFTLPYGRDGRPEAAILSLITPNGERALVRTQQTDVIEALTSSDPLGWLISVSEDVVVVESRSRHDLASPPPPPVLVERRGAITIIMLNRPAVRNAVNLALARALERAVDEFEADEDARVAILTGAGNTFCAGMDLKAAARGQFPITEGRGMLGLTGKPPTKPMIAAVEGHALAGGCELALAADLIVAADDSQFGIPEASRGLLAYAGGLLRLSQRLPRNVALEMALTGEPVSAPRLLDLGFVSRLADPGNALAVALELAETIAANAPLSVTVSKRIVVESPDWTSAESWQRQSDLAGEVIFSADAQEGIQAFAERRPPVWQGR